jgi:hypothetical protein
MTKDNGSELLSRVGKGRVGKRDILLFQQSRMSPFPVPETHQRLERFVGIARRDTLEQLGEGPRSIRPSRSWMETRPLL